MLFTDKSGTRRKNQFRNRLRHERIFLLNSQAARLIGILSSGQTSEKKQGETLRKFFKARR